MAKSLRRLLPTLILGLITILLVVGWLNRYALFDWWRLRGYQPPQRIVELADHTTMTTKGRHIFYANHPELDDKAAFNQHCTVNEQSIVLGCYVPGNGIFVYDVTDSRLNGVHEVTAAHEMLHAAYERLSSTEKKRIDTLTANVFAETQSDRLKATIKSYQDRDPSVVPNELHSILGTEVEDVGPELEAYYKQYFTDRLTIVKYSNAYEAAFQERKDKVVDYDQRLTVLKQQIDQDSASLDDQHNELTAERQHLDDLLAQKQYADYNAGVPDYNNKVKTYNATVTTVRSLIDQYNKLVAERNSVALEENELVKAIDSRPSTLPTE